jgi:hypothetical protein
MLAPTAPAAHEAGEANISYLCRNFSCIYFPCIPKLCSQSFDQGLFESVIHPLVLGKIGIRNYRGFTEWSFTTG